MTNIKDLTFEQLVEAIQELGEKKFRAEQIYSWLHKGAKSFEEMSNVGITLREKLKEKYYVSNLEIINKLVSVDGTIKYLWKLDDDECIESVVMNYKHGISICISTQVGCRMGCKFCASTIGGLKRNLGAGEILDQVIFATKDLGVRISNIVLMGIGEPLDNYDNVIIFLKNVGHPKGINIGYRHISLSTCGLVDKIYKLAEENMPITLSISLHSPNDEDRSSLMPINKKYNIDELLKACRHYLHKTGRRISFEYAMIKGKNESETTAKKLASLLKGILCHVNLIPINKVEEMDFVKSSDENIKKFRNTLEDLGINTTVRRELGSDISASCGQLRRNNIRGGDGID